MKHKSRYVILCSILFTLCIPFFYFQLLDQKELSTTKQWVGKQSNKELFENHAVVRGLYNSFYVEDSENSTYDVSNYSQYSQEQLAILNPVKDSFEKEINTLIKKKILAKEYLKLASDEPFTIPFGTLSISENESGLQYLDIIYSIENGYVEQAKFTLDKQSNKIIAFTITNPNAQSITTKQKYTLLQRFIKYLDMDDINDWNKLEGSFISYQLRAELHITEIREDKTKTFTFSFIPLGRQEYSRIAIY